MSVRVRFAPSPTGWLHVGGARTALFNYLFAKKQKGVFILRLEDTDVKRGEEQFVKSQLQALKWLGLKWEEGVDPDSLKDFGSYGPYRQSRRIDLYQSHAARLIQDGRAYYCFLSEKQIEEMKRKVLDEGKPFRVKSPYRDFSLQEAQKKIKQGEPAVVRFKVPEVKKEYVLKDIVRKEVCFPSDMIGDFVLLRSSGLPVYNFACAVDDHHMKISHVFRSEEHLANTLRQMMLCEAFSWPMPILAHLSIILAEDRKKLSKRHGATSCIEYKNAGYLPSALVNFLALLGWNPKSSEEIFSMNELIEKFSLEGLNASPAVFDEKKLQWMNIQHCKKLDDLSLWQKLQEFFDKEKFQFPNQSEAWKKRAIHAVRSSIVMFSSAVELFRPLTENHFSIDQSAKEVLEWPSSQIVLSEWKNFLDSYSKEEVNAEDFVQFSKGVQKNQNVKGKFLFMPLRIAVIGRPEGMKLKQAVPLIKRTLLLERVQKIKTL